MTETAPPVVSFLIPTGVSVPHLQECLYSILSQSFTDLEILLLDSEENPETTELAQLCAREDERIRHLVLPQSNTLPDSLNHGLQQAKGDLIWSLAPSARLSTSQSLKECVTQFILNPRLGLAFCRIQFMDEESIPYERYMPSKKNSDMPYHPTLYPGRLFFRQLLKGNLIPDSSAVARKLCLMRAGGFESSLKTAAVWQQWLRVCLDWDVYFDPLPKVLVRRARQASDPLVNRPAEELECELQAYAALEDYLKAHKYPMPARHQAQFARLQFMRRKGLKMSLPDRLIRLYRRLTSAGMALNPLEH